MEGMCQTGSIEDLRNRIEGWREAKSRLKQRRMPEELWVLAVDLARTHGVSRISGEFGLGYAGLKRRLIACPEAVESETEAFGGGFVELRNLAGCGQICVEVRRVDGCQMRIELGLGADVAPLIRTFLG